MEKSVPPIWKSVIGAYRDVFRALVDMPVIAIVAFVLSLLQATASTMLQPEDLADITLATFLYWAVVIIAFGFLMTPVLIAVHRFILLDDVARSYRITLNSRFVAFFSLALALGIFFAAVVGIGTVVSQYSGIAGIIVIAVALVAIYLLLPLSLLFPAIAVDAPAATWRNAYSDASGHVGRFFVTIVLAGLAGALVLAIVNTGVIALLWSAGFSLDDLRSPLTDFGIVAIIHLLLAGLEATILTLVPVAVLSHFYRHLGARLADR